MRRRRIMSKELCPLIGRQNAQVAKQGRTMRAENEPGDIDKQQFKIAQHALRDIVINRSRAYSIRSSSRSPP